MTNSSCRQLRNGSLWTLYSPLLSFCRCNERIPSTLPKAGAESVPRPQPGCWRTCVSARAKVRHCAGAAGPRTKAGRAEASKAGRVAFGGSWSRLETGAFIGLRRSDKCTRRRGVMVGPWNVQSKMLLHRRIPTKGPCNLHPRMHQAATASGTRTLALTFKLT